YFRRCIVERGQKRFEPRQSCPFLREAEGQEFVDYVACLVAKSGDHALADAVSGQDGGVELEYRLVGSLARPAIQRGDNAGQQEIAAGPVSQSFCERMAGWPLGRQFEQHFLRDGEDGTPEDSSE